MPVRDRRCLPGRRFTGHFVFLTLNFYCLGFGKLLSPGFLHSLGCWRGGGTLTSVRRYGSCPSGAPLVRRRGPCLLPVGSDVEPEGREAVLSALFPSCAATGGRRSRVRLASIKWAQGRRVASRKGREEVRFQSLPIRQNTRIIRTAFENLQRGTDLCPRLSWHWGAT